MLRQTFFKFNRPNFIRVKTMLHLIRAAYNKINTIKALRPIIDLPLFHIIHVQTTRTTGKTLNMYMNDRTKENGQKTRMQTEQKRPEYQKEKQRDNWCGQCGASKWTRQHRGDVRVSKKSTKNNFNGRGRR